MPGLTHVPPQAKLAGKTVFSKPLDTANTDDNKNNTLEIKPSAHDDHHHHTNREDPHVLPDFTVASLQQPSEPVLYLPPLLSSLPQSYPHIEITHDLAPLKTSTRLPDIDPASLSLHKALHHFRPFANYASVPYAEAFNWSELELPEEEDREWYIVAFRSRRKDGSDGSREFF